jgi:hypothetical protein
MRCACCGWSMGTTTVSDTGLYYRCRKRIGYGKDACDMKKHLRADSVEPLVWTSVSEVLGDPEVLRRGLERMREKEMDASPVDNEEEACAWRDKLSEIQRKRGDFQDLAAEGLMTKAELRSRLEELELAREAAEHELRLLDDHRRKLSDLERDVEALLQDYERICVEELADLSPEERREVYGMLGLTVEAYPDGKLEATWLLNATLSKVRSRSRRPCGLCP